MALGSTALNTASTGRPCWRSSSLNTRLRLLISNMCRDRPGRCLVATIQKPEATSAALPGISRSIWRSWPSPVVLVVMVASRRGGYPEERSRGIHTFVAGTNGFCLGALPMLGQSLRCSNREVFHAHARERRHGAAHRPARPDRRAGHPDALPAGGIAARAA